MTNTRIAATAQLKVVSTRPMVCASSVLLQDIPRLLMEPRHALNALGRGTATIKETDL